MVASFIIVLPERKNIELDHWIREYSFDGKPEFFALLSLCRRKFRGTSRVRRRENSEQKKDFAALSSLIF